MVAVPHQPGYGFGMFHLAFSIVILAASPSLANVPRYDPERWCNAVASEGGNYSRVIMNGCLQQEQAAYDQLGLEWATLPSSMQSWCDEVAKEGDEGGSYVILLGCVEQEQKAGRDVQQFRFKR